MFNIQRIARITILVIFNIWAIQLLGMEIEWQWIEWGFENYGSNGLLGGLCEVADNLLFAGEFIQAMVRLIANHPHEVLFMALLAYALQIGVSNDLRTSKK